MVIAFIVFLKGKKGILGNRVGFSSAFLFSSSFLIIASV